MNNIVLFGADNSGKSTLANQLVNLLNDDIDFSCDSMHTPGPVGYDGMKKYMEDNLIPKTSNHIRVFDRFPIIEESVYGPLFRKGSVFTDEEYNKSIFLQIDLFIFCNPGKDKQLNWGEREQYPGVIENGEKLIDEYIKVYHKLKEQGYNVKEYNYTTDDYRRLV